MLYPSYNRVGFKSVLESPTSIGQIHDIKVPAQPEEFYVSIHRFDESIAALPSLGDLPPGTVSYCDFLFIDLDSHTNLGAAYRDALTICASLDKLNAVYELWYSGGKGFHVAIPTSQFGYAPTADAGILKRMAEGIKGDIKTTKEGGTFDPSIYNQTRIFRYPGTWNKKGGYKSYVKSSWETVHFALQDVVRFSQKEYHLSGNDAEYYSDLPLNSALVQLYEFCKSAPLKQQAAVVGESMFAPCLEGGRNEQAFTIAHRLFKKGVFRQDVEAILGLWNQQNPKPLTPSEVRKVIGSAEKGRVELTGSNVESCIVSVGETLAEYQATSGTKKTKFLTGYNFLDEFTLGGFEQEEAVFLSARSANFKTSTLTNVLQRGTTLAKKPGLFFSQEMGRKTLLPRLIQQAEGLTKAEVLERMSKGDNFEKTREAFQYLQIVYLSSLTTEQMMDITEAFYKKHGYPSVIGVDYLGLFKGCNNDTQKTAKQAQDIKTIVAKDCKCPVITLTQAKQIYEGREGDRELARNSGKDSDSILDLSDYYLGVWGHWHTFINTQTEEAYEEKIIYGRVLKARGMDSDKYPPNPYCIMHWDKPRLQLKDILYVPKPPKFKQAREEQ